MSALIYLHGFLSSPQSLKARQTEAWLREHRPDIRYLCPALSSHPAEAEQQLLQLLEGLDGDAPLGILGSSLGGFWATYLLETPLAHARARAVLVNPAVQPHTRFDEFVGRELKHYHSGASFRLEPQDLATLAAADRAQLQNPARYWVLLQTGDETLDYRLAAQKYAASKLTIGPGGNHSFENFQRWLPKIVDSLFPSE